MTTFITTEDLTKQTQISENVDVGLLQPHIEISQDMYIRSILGDALTDQLLSEIESNTITGINKTLWLDYIVPACSYATWFSATPFLQFKTHRSGLVKQSTDNSESITMEEFSYYSKRVEQTMRFYTSKLEKYLDDNYQLFPNYRKDCGIGGSKGSTSGLYLGFK